MIDLLNSVSQIPSRAGIEESESPLFLLPRTAAKKKKASLAFAN